MSPPHTISVQCQEVSKEESGFSSPTVPIHSLSSHPSLGVTPSMDTGKQGRSIPIVPFPNSRFTKSRIKWLFYAIKLCMACYAAADSANTRYPCWRMPPASALAHSWYWLTLLFANLINKTESHSFFSLSTDISSFKN